MIRLEDYFLLIKSHPETFFKNYTGKGNYETYIWFNISRTNYYIGRGKIGRCLNHRGDSLSRTQNNFNWVYISIEGLTLQQSQALESWGILKGLEKYELSPRGSKMILPNRLLNKRREIKQERFITAEIIYGNNSRYTT